MPKKFFQKAYDKMLEAEDGFSDALSKASSVLGNVTYISNPRVRNALKGVNVAISAGIIGHTAFKYIQESVESSKYTLVINDMESLPFRVATDFMFEYKEDRKVRDYDLIVNYERIPHTDKQKAVLSTEVGEDTVVRAEFKGHDYQFVLSHFMPEKEEGSKKAVSMGLRTVTIYTKKKEGVDVIRDEFQRRVELLSKEKFHPQIYINTDWGGFTSNDLRYRNIDSVILKDGQIEEIKSHIRKFLDSEEDYNKYGIPYHTGIMFSGPPGTGKSSVTTALAHEFNMHVYQISLSTMEDDDDLFSAFSSVRPRSIVLLEDLDVLAPSNAMDRDAEDSEGITMSGLLNVLDGNMTPHGMILFATTNNPENIDPALTRTGRIDLKVELNYMNTEQLQRLVKFFVGKVVSVPEIDESVGISCSDVTGIFRPYLDNPIEALDDLNEFIMLKKVEVDVAGIK